MSGIVPSYSAAKGALGATHQVHGHRESVTALKGMFGKPRKSVSIEQMNAAIARRGSAADK